MRKVIIQVISRNNTVKGYYVDGISEMLSEDRVLSLVSKGEVSCNILADGSIDTHNMIVYRSEEDDIVDTDDDYVDSELVNVCLRIRRLAKLDRLQIQESEHSSNNGLNTHLFSYLRYCGKDLKSFVKDYLSNLQPYMLVRRKDQEPNNQFICVLDTVYRISVYIKLYKKQFEEVVVSFHEDNKRGVAKTNDLITKERLKDKVFVFADSEQGFMVDRITQKRLCPY